MTTPQSTNPHDVSELTDNVHVNARASNVVNYLDKHVSETVDLLTNLGIMDNTLFVFTSTGGPDDSLIANSRNSSRELLNETINSNGRFYGYKNTLGEGAVRIPLIVTGRDIQNSTTATTVVTLADISQTIVDIIGLEIPVQFSGISFLETLQSGVNQTTNHDYIHFESCNSFNDCDIAYLFGDNLQYKRVCSTSDDVLFTSESIKWTKLVNPGDEWTLNDSALCRLGSNDDGYFSIYPSYTDEMATSLNPFVFGSVLSLTASEFFTKQIRRSNLASTHVWDTFDFDSVVPDVFAPVVTITPDSETETPTTPTAATLRPTSSPDVDIGLSEVVAESESSSQTGVIIGVVIALIIIGSLSFFLINRLMAR